eukprot:TRINITY_DN8563_c0_g1_i1.p4 TRINITY_DN8563_c0_g1~~TRINITY_DN8563_c0_g1_i1.p4  ORF type:complete len:106 (-),score=40.70 TRINITY_DN8563_c0_g1_i1:10-294(-)
MCIRDRVSFVSSVLILSLFNISASPRSNVCKPCAGTFFIIAGTTISGISFFSSTVSIVGCLTLTPPLSICLSCCLLYTSPSPRDLSTSRMPSSA